MPEGVPRNHGISLIGDACIPTEKIHVKVNSSILASIAVGAMTATVAAAETELTASTAVEAKISRVMAKSSTKTIPTSESIGFGN